MPEIEEHFGIADCIDGLEDMFAEMGAGRAITDSREDVLTPVQDPPEGSTEPVYHGLKSMGGSIPAMGVGAIRINSDVINWPTKNGSTVREKIPAAPGERYTGLVLLFSTNTGEPLAIFPDGLVQSYRVGGTSALGAKYLARDDASELAMLGAGWQARAHLRALDAVRDLDAVRVYSPTPESREEYAAEMGEALDLDVRAVDDPEDAVAGADIVQCATNSLSPVFEREWLDPGTHVGFIRDSEAPEGFFAPEEFDAFCQSWSTVTQLEELGSQLNEREIPTKNVNNYVVEGEEPLPKFRDREMTDEPLCDWETVPGLGAVVAAARESPDAVEGVDGDDVGRSSPDGITAFYNRGMGIQFAGAGKVLYDIAEAEDLGKHIPTELFTQEYHP
jgi:ornithine cyclodeaminase/alanine dehydrogenase-like protein (mu-crystallin family)